MKVTDSAVKNHFNSLADRYDWYKEKNSYYYETIKAGLRKEIPKGKKVLDFGCGTGDLLLFLEPSYGLGIDISGKLIKIAKKKVIGKKNIEFSLPQKKPKGYFDYIILIDVVEHLSHVQKTISQLKSYSDNNTVLIISYVGGFWEPVLDFLEKINFKMPEGPHNRINTEELLKILDEQGFYLKSKKTLAPLPPKLGLVKGFLEKTGVAPISFAVFGSKGI